MVIKNKYNMTPEQNKRYAKTNLSRLISSERIFEGNHFTSTKLETIIFNFEVTGISVSENIVIPLDRYQIFGDKLSNDGEKEIKISMEYRVFH